MTVRPKTATHVPARSRSSCGSISVPPRLILGGADIGSQRMYLQCQFCDAPKSPFYPELHLDRRGPGRLRWIVRVSSTLTGCCQCETSTSTIISRTTAYCFEGCWPLLPAAWLLSAAGF